MLSSTIARSFEFEIKELIRSSPRNRENLNRESALSLALSTASKIFEANADADAVKLIRERLLEYIGHGSFSANTVEALKDALTTLEILAEDHKL